MKKSHEIRPNIMAVKNWALAMFLFVFSGSLAYGQGFYKHIPSPFISTLSAVRVICSPGGEFVLPMHDGDHGPLGWVRTSATGDTLISKFRSQPFSQTESFVVTNDGNYLVIDSSFNTSAPAQHDLKMRWYDFNGNLLQTRIHTLDPNRGYYGFGQVLSDDAGDIYFVGAFSNATNDLKFYTLKFDASGNILSQFQLANTSLHEFTTLHGVALGKDGTFLVDFTGVIPGFFTRNVLRINMNTGQESSYQIGVPYKYSIAGDANGGTLYSSNSSLYYTNSTQTISWTKDIPTLLNDPNATGANFCMAVSGGWVFQTNNQSSAKFCKIDAQGSLVWQRSSTALPPGGTSATAGKELPDGSLIFSGTFAEQPWLLKLNPNGTLFPHNITGTVIKDTNSNCFPDAGEPGAVNRVVSAKRISDGIELFGTTDINGNYIISDLDTGVYVVQAFPINFQWQICGTPDTITFSDPNMPSTAIADFEMQVLYECPQLWASISTAQLRVCEPEQYAVSFCNSGTQTATDAYVEVTLPPAFIVSSSSVPYTLVAPNMLHFEVGTVPIDSCGTFYIDGLVDCDPVLSGQTLCATAAVYPDTTCFPGAGIWSGASIQVVGHCDPDSVRFEIINSGNGSTAQTLGFIIVEDHVISLTDGFNLPSGANKTIALPKNGSTWRIQADQEPHHPLGTEPASVAVEGCVLNGSSFSTGMVNLFPNNFGTPNVNINCQVVLNAYDPNDKKAAPIGLHDEHFIEQNISLEYQINFQNTGTAPAKTVVLKDSLSPWLNPASIRMGAASHPYTWSLSGSGILQVRFDNINLPDSNSNEAASHGFVRFRVEQHPDNPIGTVIKNQAGIYFGVNPVVLTNVVEHTIGADFIEVVAVTAPEGTPLHVIVQPNPVVDEARIILESLAGSAQFFELFDVSGKRVQTLHFSGNELYFQRQGLPSGLYFFNIANESGKPIARGKLILN